MARTLKIRRPTPREMLWLQFCLEDPLSPQVHRRAGAILNYGLGMTAKGIADTLHVHPNTIYADLHAFGREGLRCVHPLPRGGAPLRITPQQREQIWDWAQQSPRDLGLLDSRWTLANLREFLIHHAHVIEQISLEHLRRLLQQKGMRFRRVTRKLTSTDPQRPAILARIRRVFQHLPANGVMVFFDVKPVTVKAYGGRRWSTHRIVLPKYQKTRGRFYLFALYDVKQGRVRWRYYPAKDACHVCRFMHWIRRWYPAAEVWVVLDQDSIHPRKCAITRRVMRELGLHWISLPKASPDDNPCETLFSDIQLNVLDNSDDLDQRTTQKRISCRWTRRNRRRDRFIEIPYLWNSHKG